MDKAGEGEEVRLADLPSAKELALQGFGHDLFQEVRRSGPPAAAGWVCGRLRPGVGSRPVL